MPGKQRQSSAFRAGLVTLGARFLRGRTAAAAELNPTQKLAAALAPASEVEIPKPRKTRYPISLKEFDRRKSDAVTVKRKLDRRGVTIVHDKKKGKQQEIALRMMPAAAVGGGSPGAAAPTLTALSAFEGIPATTWLPPDCTMAAGPSHVIASVNSTIAVYAKTGGAPLLQRTLTAWFANVSQNATIFDPKLLYDQHAGRWVLLAVALGKENQSFFLLSASASSDPMGPWRNYALNAAKDGTTSTNNWADYPGLGVDAQAIYLTANMFKVDGNFVYAKIRIVPKAAIYAGAAATFLDLVRMKNADGSFAFTVQPCHTFGAPQAAYFVNSLFPSGQELSIWSLTNPLTQPRLTRRRVAVPAYDLPPDAEQKGGATALDSGDVRILHAIFRGGSIWTALTTRHQWAGGNAAAVQWFQIDATTGGLVQQGIYGADRRHYFYPAFAPDSNGNVIAVFCVSSPNEYASIYFSGRTATDPVGELRPSLVLKAGTASYVGPDSSGRNRWGDYCGIASDPASGSNVWFYSMFAEAPNKWGTWIGSATT
ncbi:MAG: hypothetical protein QOH01_2111 [Verrucomicrobiota bacterium]|jgi:hypothetical protein